MSIKTVVHLAHVGRPLPLLEPRPLPEPRPRGLARPLNDVGNVSIMMTALVS